MPMEADAVIWGTLLAASKTHGNTEIGKRAAENLARVEPCHGPSRVLLSNIYADAGKWEDAFLVRQEMQTQRLTRATAYSGVMEMEMSVYPLLYSSSMHITAIECDSTPLNGCPWWWTYLSHVIKQLGDDSRAALL
nr:pentatricopeptide repeat-containing protein At5g19020, mitochondrial [Ipomoea batatas]